MIIRAIGLTDVGLSKTINEDSFCYRTDKVLPQNEYMGLYAVADGVGGLERGEVASGIAIKELEKWWENEFLKLYGNIEAIVESLITKLENINYDIALYSNKLNCHMATTLSILLIYKDMYYIIHIGDSRIIRVNKAVAQLTKDHIKINLLTQESRLCQYLGGQREEFDYQCTSGPVKNNDFFIVGSDGIFKKSNDDDINMEIDRVRQAIISPQTACENMIELVKGRGEKDNITIILVTVSKI